MCNQASPCATAGSEWRASRKVAPGSVPQPVAIKSHTKIQLDRPKHLSRVHLWTTAGTFQLFQIRWAKSYTPPKFYIAPEKRRLENYSPIEKVTFQGRNNVKLREGTQKSSFFFSVTNHGICLNETQPLDFNSETHAYHGSIPNRKHQFWYLGWTSKTCSTETIQPWKLTWHWKITIFNRTYIFKWWIFHCHVSFFGRYIFIHGLFASNINIFADPCLENNENTQTPNPWEVQPELVINYKYRHIIIACRTLLMLQCYSL